MVHEKKYREQLQLNYYDLITTISPNNREDFNAKISLGINTILGTVFAVVYRFDLLTKSFQLMSGTSEFGKDAKIILNDTLEDSDYRFRDSIINGSSEIQIDPHDIFTMKSVEIDYVVLPLFPASGPISMLVLGIVSQDQRITPNVRLVVKEETEKLLSHVYKLDQAKINEEKSKFLFEMTSRFFTLNNKTDIFTEIISTLREVYPSFRYYLLLTQDHEDTDALPVRALEFSDDSTKRVSSQAFINGEVQIEDRIHEENTCVYAPLKGFQGVYGVLQIVIPSIIEVPQGEIDFITKLANAAGKAIENSSLYQNAKHHVSDLKLINDITHQLNSNLDLTEITSLVRNQIIQTCNAEEIGFVYKKQELAHDFEILDGSTAYFKTIEGKGIIRYLVEDILARKEAIFSGEYKNDQIQVPFRSVMVIPMENSATINGFVVVLHKDPYAFSFDKFKLLQSLIRHSTLAFVNTILKEQLQKAASTDYLTQLYSRNYLDTKIMQHREIGETGTLILFDIDDFKKVNDTHGHYIGDEVIKQVADIIMSSIEERDVAARWGGEELAIYLPNTSLNEGVKLARSINNQVENFTEPRVTLSAGVSTWNSKEVDTAREFFVRADKALYEAKSFGKNCVVKYDTEEKEGINS